VPVFKAANPPGPVRVRNLTADELRDLWFFVGWDLEDPLFMVEQEAARFVVGLDAKGALHHLDDLSSMCFTARTDDKQLLPCTCLWTQPDGSRSSSRPQTAQRSEFGRTRILPTGRDGHYRATRRMPGAGSAAR